MKNTVRFLLGALLCIAAVPPCAQAADITGTWQGRLMMPATPVRRVMKISRNAGGKLTAIVYSIDETDDPIPVQSVSLDGSTLRLVMNVNRGEWRNYHRTYQGTVSADGQSIAGKWNAPGIGVLQMNFRRATPQTAWAIPRPPVSRYVTVAPGVKLEVVDWGGTGTPIVFLAGLGNTAHVFSGQGFARSFTDRYHVYGITRRGFGESGKPAPTVANYNADRLGEDVVAVLDALHIERPILIGHSIAGEELSSIGTHHPDKVSALVYLDAGYAYALYDPNAGSIERYEFDESDLKRDLAAADAGSFANQQTAAHRLLTDDIPRIEHDLRVRQTFYAALIPPPAGAPQPADPIGDAILKGMRRYTGPISVPILAIYAAPHNWGAVFGKNHALDAAAQKAEYQDELTQIAAFKRHLPSAKVIQVPHADHYVFVSNRAEVLRDVNEFLKSLP
jgi:pimeloyl-ACP methyl ester carboxylesterase